MAIVRGGMAESQYGLYVEAIRNAYNDKDWTSSTFDEGMRKTVWR